LVDVAMQASFEILVIKSTMSLYIVKCVNKKCKWTVRAAQLRNSSYFSIRTYCSTHTCSLVNRKLHHRQTSSNVVTEMVTNNFRCQQNTHSPKAIMTMMQNRGHLVSYWKAWNGKRLANNLLKGSPKQSFELMPSYLYVVKSQNPSTITHLEVDEQSRFQYLFLAFGACIRGFSFMRKVITVDGT